MTGTVPDGMREAITEHGTPAYLYDLAELRRRVRVLRTRFPGRIGLYYSLKANPAVDVCAVLASEGIGAEVSSAGEWAAARAAGFRDEAILATGPYHEPAVLDAARESEFPLSCDSPGELRRAADATRSAPLLARLRPTFSSSAVVCTDETSRFGMDLQELTHTIENDPELASRIQGFHVFAGSQVCDTDEVLRQLRESFTLCAQATEHIGITPAVLDLGGGFGVPYGPEDPQLDLDAIADELATLAERAAPTRIVIELGRYIVAPIGWYAVTVVGHQHRAGRTALIVDGGVHHRADICGVDLARRGPSPHVVENGTDNTPGLPTAGPVDILGCLCLPEDVLAENVRLSGTARGTVVAFPQAGAYGLSAAPQRFLSHAPPVQTALEHGNHSLLRSQPDVPISPRQSSTLHAPLTSS
ncbi:hypothetical protein [Actinopolyspora halophila]|uniref:hypothetical protein n=1 Tax=Actinopolyspora halophila TaxID=1850 RepID=UPI000369304C|nr:hypothetical protein [Actinopolyspora halophila]